MQIWRLKRCPRCEGDLFVDRDIWGWYEQCLQCSYVRELTQEGLGPVVDETWKPPKLPVYRPTQDEVDRWALKLKTAKETVCQT